MVYPAAIQEIANHASRVDIVGGRAFFRCSYTNKDIISSVGFPSYLVTGAKDGSKSRTLGSFSCWNVVMTWLNENRAAMGEDLAKGIESWVYANVKNEFKVAPSRNELGKFGGKMTEDKYFASFVINCQGAVTAASIITQRAAEAAERATAPKPAGGDVMISAGSAWNNVLKQLPADTLTTLNVAAVPATGFYVFQPNHATPEFVKEVETAHGCSVPLSTTDINTLTVGPYLQTKKAKRFVAKHTPKAPKEKKTAAAKPKGEGAPKKARAPAHKSDGVKQLKRKLAVSKGTDLEKLLPATEDVPKLVTNIVGDNTYKVKPATKRVRAQKQQAVTA